LDASRRISTTRAVPRSDSEKMMRTVSRFPDVSRITRHSGLHALAAGHDFRGDFEAAFFCMLSASDEAGHDTLCSVAPDCPHPETFAHVGTAAPGCPSGPDSPGRSALESTTPPAPTPRKPPASVSPAPQERKTAAHRP
jgi:hypothetical protein